MNKSVRDWVQHSLESQGMGKRLVQEKKKIEDVAERFSILVKDKITDSWDFLGGPVVKTLRFHYKGHRFNPWSGNEDLACNMVWQKLGKKKKSTDSRNSGNPKQDKCQPNQPTLQKPKKQNDPVRHILKPKEKKKYLKSTLRNKTICWFLR